MDNLLVDIVKKCDRLTVYKMRSTSSNLSSIIEKYGNIGVWPLIVRVYDNSNCFRCGARAKLFGEVMCHTNVCAVVHSCESCKLLLRRRSIQLAAQYIKLNIRYLTGKNKSKRSIAYYALEKLNGLHTRSDEKWIRSVVKKISKQ